MRPKTEEVVDWSRDQRATRCDALGGPHVTFEDGSNSYVL
jgi:hypothetical protein